mmetsp:Transcript_15793/g.21377  ORF Transcript_15793/g.21377 Transcript_15793/m.21377 type:complete len:81 (-) Transcript_15793:1161-1403(-)
MIRGVIESPQNAMDLAHNSKKHRSMKLAKPTKIIDKENKDSVMSPERSYYEGVARNKLRGDPNGSVRHSSSNIIQRRTFA